MRFDLDYCREYLREYLPGLASNPEQLERSLAQFYQLHCQKVVPSSILELCRLRMAAIQDVPAMCVAAPWCDLPPSLVAAVVAGSWRGWPGLDETSEACLALAEAYALDPTQVTCEQAEAVKRSLGEAGYAVLMEALGLFDAMARRFLLQPLLQGCRCMIA